MASRRGSDPLTDLWNKLPPYLRNRYFLTTIAFVFFMVFIDRHDVLTQFRLRTVVNRLEADREYYDQKIDEAEAERLDRELNQERFARETYFMQRDDEDVFIIVPEEAE